MHKNLNIRRLSSTLQCQFSGIVVRRPATFTFLRRSHAAIAWCSATVESNKAKAKDSSPKGKVRSPRQKPESNLDNTSDNLDEQEISASVHAKGDYVKGIVEFVDETSVTVLLSSGEWGKLMWSNFTKDPAYKASAVDSKALLAVGDKIWATVLRVPAAKDRSTDARVMLSTAALEVRPGDILRNKTHVFSAMDQWASRAGAAVPLSEWRGRIELEQFLAGPPGVRVAAGGGSGGKGGKAEAGATTGVAGGVESSGSPRMDDDDTSGPSERREGPVPASLDVSSWGIVSRPQVGQGDLVWSTVKSVKPYGVFVSLSKQQDALMPVSQISKAFTPEKELNGLLKRGDKVLVVVKKNMDGNERDIDGGDGGDSSSEERKAGPEGLPGRDGDKASDRSSWGEVESPSGGRALSDAIAGTKDSERLKFVVSSRTLEAEVGIIKRSLTEYNQSAMEVHKEYTRNLAEQNLAEAATSHATFKSAKSAWQDRCSEIPVGAIVKGTVFKVTHSAVFVRLDSGPTALIHEDDVSRNHFKDLNNILKVGSTVYGRVYPYPTNTKEAIMAEVESPTDLWMSIKQLEPPKTPGLVLKEREKFWELARKMQEEESGQASAEGSASMAMHAFDLDSRQLMAAIKRLSYIPWHLLAGRPNPGLLMNRRAPPPSQWGGRYDDLAAQYEASRSSLQDEVESLLPAALRVFVSKAVPRGTPVGIPSGDLEAGTGGEGILPNIRHSIDTAVRHAWTTSRAETKAMVELMAGVRLTAAAAAEAWRLRDGADGDGGEPGSVEVVDPGAEGAGVSSELDAAAAHVVDVARLLKGAEGGAMVADMITVLRSLGRKRLPQGVLDSLVLWGWELVQAADKRGGAAALRGSGVLEALADDGFRPTQQWREPVFRLLFNNMVADGEPGDMAYFLRLMAALGHRPPDNAWWDRFLIRVYYKHYSGRSRRQAGGEGDEDGGFMAQELEEIRTAAAALVAAS